MVTHSFLATWVAGKASIRLIIVPGVHKNAICLVHPNIFHSYGISLGSQKFFYNLLFLLAFLEDQNIFWSRPGIYANLLTLFLTTKNEERRTKNFELSR